MHVSFLGMLVITLRHFQRKWFSLKVPNLESEATLHSLRTVNWSVGTDCFSFRETHVTCWWMLVSSLRQFQRKVIFSESTAFRKWSNTPFSSHSELKCWDRLHLFQRSACEFLLNTCKYLKAVSKNLIISVTTAFKKWSYTPFTSHRELLCWNRLRRFQRNSCELLVNACKLLKALSKESDYLCNDSI